jgi:hypothetical protein
MRGFEKKFLDPSYVPMRVFEAAPGGARAVFHFLHQNETTAG